MPAVCVNIFRLAADIGQNQALDAEPPIALFLGSVLTGGNPVKILVATNP